MASHHQHSDNVVPLWTAHDTFTGAPVDYPAGIRFVHPIRPHDMAAATRDEEMLEAYSDDEEGVSAFIRETKDNLQRGVFWFIYGTLVLIGMIVAFNIGRGVL